MKLEDFKPAVGTVVRVGEPAQFVSANFEAFSRDMQDVLVSVSGHPKQHVGSDLLFWVPVQKVRFEC